LVTIDTKLNGKNIVGVSKVFQHGKTQLPREVRKLLELKDGDRVYYVQDDFGRIFLEKAPGLVKKHVGKYV